MMFLKYAFDAWGKCSVLGEDSEQLIKRVCEASRGFGRRGSGFDPRFDPISSLELALERCVNHEVKDCASRSESENPSTA